MQCSICYVIRKLFIALIKETEVGTNNNNFSALYRITNKLAGSCKLFGIPGRAVIVFNS